MFFIVHVTLTFFLLDATKIGPIPVQHGDMIILGTDGLFDNLFNEELLKIMEEQHLMVQYAMNYPLVYNNTTGISSNSSNNAVLTTWKNWLFSCAESIAKRALHVARTSHIETPFTVNANKVGKEHQGGKYDDITVIVGRVVKVIINKQ